MGKGTDKTTSPSALFIVMGLDMTWRLALAVLVPIIGGYALDKALHTLPWLFILGFILATVGATLVIRQTVRKVNEHPVFLNPSKKESK